MTIRSRHKLLAPPGSGERGLVASGGRTDVGRSTLTVRQYLTRWLADYRWPVLGTAAVVAFALGCWGYATDIKGSTPFDAVYWSLKDFALNGPDNPHLTWPTNIGRFLAPIVAGWAGLSALGSLFRDRVQQMRIPRMKDHVVICGVGRYVGGVFLRHLQEAGIPAVAIDSDAANSNIEMCRTLGVPVIVGDAQLQRTLQAAGVDRAARLVAVTDDDAVNTQIVAAARGLPRRQSSRLSCLARISDPELCGLLRIQEAKLGDASLSLDFFNTDEISARPGRGYGGAGPPRWCRCRSRMWPVS